MIYKNGRDVIPPSLLRELQKYVDGELIYIPKLDDKRARWGEVSGTRKLLAERNKEICRLHSDGSTIAELERRYHLTGESIRKIIFKFRNHSVTDAGVHVDSNYDPVTFSRATVR
ncbi:CD3324 family protein [Cohnella suwonensis]|uniref:CD3324 family protein n=1 Tax=Cohnella suwonensis TaxID=696072 RepID=A0ABW0LZ34_9BACL